MSSESSVSSSISSPSSASSASNSNSNSMDNSNAGSMGSTGGTAAANAAGDLPGGLSGLLSQPLAAGDSMEKNSVLAMMLNAGTGMPLVPLMGFDSESDEMFFPVDANTLGNVQSQSLTFGNSALAYYLMALDFDKV